jgi:hypothetical protein
MKAAEIKVLQTEVDKQTDLQYLKQVTWQYLSSSDTDVTNTQVQGRLVQVLMTLLKFTQEEMMTVQRSRAPKGLLTRFLRMGS